MNLEINGKILGNGRVLVSDGKYVKKYYFQEKMFNEIEKATFIMKDFHPDLFKKKKKNDIMIVTTHFIDSIDCTVVDYRTNVKNYLKLFEWFGETITKRDLVPSNILYRKTDNKFFIIDWDNVQYLKNKAECYNFYKEQLCDHRWQDTFKMNRKEVEKIFEEEWNNVH